MNPRNLLMGVGISSLALNHRWAAAAAHEVELTPIPMESDGLSGMPVADQEMYRGDITNLWDAPWEIGDDLVESGVTIVQRSIETADQGYQLGLDGLVFQSVIYAKHDFQRILFIGVNSDLSEITDARTLIVTGTYGGIQHNTDSLWEDPILIAREIDVL